MQAINVGADVAKDAVVVACATDHFAPRSIANRRSELRMWLKTLPAGTRLAMEATGRYHTLLADLAHEQGLQVYVLNPKDVRHYALGLGRRGKTDRVDAQVIARYISKEHEALHPYVPPTPQQRLLDQLIKRRARLVALRGALSACGGDLVTLKAELASVLQRLNLLIRRLDQQRNQLIAASMPWQASVRRLKTIAGVGPLVAAGLLHAFDRISFRKADAFVAYTGLDPRPMDSGTKTGVRRLSKRGPSELRRLLYNAAMAASRTRAWRPYYLRHRDTGLSTTAALVVLARKIARVAWVIHYRQVDFQPERLIAA
jgi:transposase